ncbi:alpha/beta hydrolase [Brevibacillus halotolerans]|uniref:alpha/beta hydrolase n=1 Tax=Brevibacillus halotolerans TaxID=1507437 RepID=UPI001BB3874B|nr:alpha/beta hydrolase-fold protein [Brevibacillus halotolerans]
MKQTEKRSAFAIPGAEQRTVISNRGASYRIMVYKPEVPTPETGFPVIYMLDANSAFGSMAETVRLQTRGPHMLEPAVVVGIGYDTDQPFETNRRFYDYTVYADKTELPNRKDGSEWPTTGGADVFLTFIEEELKPLIEQEISIDRNRQTLFGHSLGGLFTLYTMFTKRQAFQVYAAGSPSIWWKNQFLFPLAERFAKEAQESTAEPIQTSLLIGIGSEEKAEMVVDAKEMYERLSSSNIPGMQVQYRCFDDEGHLSVLLPYIGLVIRSALAKK